MQTSSVVPGMQFSLALQRRGKEADTALVPSADGCIGQLEDGDRITVKLRVPVHSHVVSVTGKLRVITLLRPRGQAQENSKGYQFTVPVRCNQPTGIPDVDRGRDFTTPLVSATFGSMRLLTVQEGRLRVYRVGIVGQRGIGFFRERLQYNEPVFRDGDAVVCPGLAQWPDLQRVLSALYRDLPLPPVTEDLPMAPAAVQIPRGVGVVVWYDEFTGQGVVQTAAGNFFVHWRHILPRESSIFLALMAGERVEWQRQQPRPGREDQEIIGVRVLSGQPIIA